MVARNQPHRGEFRFFPKCFDAFCSWLVRFLAPTSGVIVMPVTGASGSRVVVHCQGNAISPRRLWGHHNCQHPSNPIFHIVVDGSLILVMLHGALRWWLPSGSVGSGGRTWALLRRPQDRTNLFHDS